MSARSIRIKNEAGYFEFGEDSSTHSAPDPDLYTSGDAGTADANAAERGEGKALPNVDVVASGTPGGQKVLVSIINPNVDSTVDFRLAVQARPATALAPTPRLSSRRPARWSKTTPRLRTGSGHQPSPCGRGRTDGVSVALRCR